MFTGFALLVVTLINGEEYEAVPMVFDTYQECRVYEEKVSKDYYDTTCFEGVFKKN